MNPFDLLRAFASDVLDQNNRPVRLHWGDAQKGLEQVLVVQRIDISEGLCSGIEGHLTCLSARADLPLKAFIGLPVAVELTTDQGALHKICGLITDARAGQSDGSLATYQLTMRDALSVLERRVNTRIFRSKSVPDVIEILLREWQQKSSALASAFDFDLSGVDRGRYPARELIFQFHESDADFVRRLCRRDGIAWFTAAGKREQDSSQRDSENPVHTLVLFDDCMTLPQASAGTVRYHRDAATEERDSITLWSSSQQLVAGSVQRASWDYKVGSMAQVSQSNVIDQGPAGNDLSQLLSESVIDVPHAGDSWSDYDRIGRIRMLAHELRAVSVDAASGVRDLAVGRWFELEGHPEVDTRPETERQFVVTSLHHRAENNLPKDLNERAQALFDVNRWNPVSMTASFASGSKSSPGAPGNRYGNTFTCVQRGIALTPAYDPRFDLPRVYPMTAMVVGPDGEEVYCDELGRIKVQIQGLSPDDHAHAQGAGTSGTDNDSAFVRVSSSWAGANYGHDTLPRIGMEVALDFLNGDPDKMFVTGVLHNGPNRPATFSHTGNLPGNRFLSGMKTKEIAGARYNQLRFDDTGGEISSQLASEHTHTQLNLGYLTQPRDEGKGDPRGEGLEARTDAQAVLRGGKGVYVTAQSQGAANGNMLERAALQGLIEQLQGIVKNLGDASNMHKAENTDVARIQKISEQIKNWDGATNVNKSGADGGAPMVAIDAPEGIAVGSRDGLVLGAQTHIDAVSVQNTQISAGKSLLMRAGEIVSAFASKGMKLITAEGKAQIEAHKEDIELTAAKRIVLTAGEEVIILAPKVTIRAKEEAVVNGGGSYSNWKASGIVHGTSGIWREHAASHSLVGPDNKPPKIPDPVSYQELEQQQSLALTLLTHPTGGRPLMNVPYTLYKGGTKVEDGVTDQNGQLIIKNHQPGTPSYTVKLYNGHEIDLPVKETLETQDDKLAAQGYRAAQGEAEDRAKHHLYSQG